MFTPNSLREEWLAAAKRLGIQAHGPVQVQLPSGEFYEFSVLLPQFGAESGMLLHTEYDRNACAAATSAGYGYSILDASLAPHDRLDLDGYIDCLIDWGWVSSELPPSWYDSNKRE